MNEGGCRHHVGFDDLAAPLFASPASNHLQGASEGNRHTDEMELVLQIGRGDRNAFELFYDRYAGILYSTALKILNDQADAEDVVQDVLVTIWEKAAMYDQSRGKPLTWAVTMTRNKAIDRLRSVRRRFRLKDQVEAESSLDAASHQPNPPEEIDLMEKSVIVRDAVIKLSKEQRQVIELAYFGGLTQNEIAEKLQEPLGTVKARIRRGMMKLRQLIPETI